MMHIKGKYNQDLTTRPSRREYDWLQERRNTMGDKGGKKNKEKGQKQKATKQTKDLEEKKDKQPKAHWCRRYRKRPQNRYFRTGQCRDMDGPLPWLSREGRKGDVPAGRAWHWHGWGGKEFCAAISTLRRSWCSVSVSGVWLAYWLWTLYAIPRMYMAQTSPGKPSAS